MGGNGGELVENFTSWTKENKVKKVTRALLREYLANNNLEISKELEGQVFKESKKKASRIDYIDMHET